MLTQEEIEQRIVDSYDPDFFVEALGITIEELVYRFRDKIYTNRETFIEDEETDDDD